MIQFRLISRRTALVMAFTLLYQVCFPTIALALTSGPTQPEASTFTPVGVSDMVDLFTGDFHYNIPLLDVGGYPINLAYNAGVGMDDEASWVGLGWNLNPGVINRDMRGLPDDFRSDSITKSFNLKPDVTNGGTISGGVEFVGLKFLKAGQNLSIGLYKNTYRGYGFTTSISPTFSISKENLGSMSIGLGLSNDSQQGYSVDPSVSLSSNEIPLLSNIIGLGNKGEQNYLRASLGFNSRRGLKDITLATPLNAGKLGRILGLQLNVNLLSFQNTTYTPTQTLPLKNTSFSFHGTIGGEAYGFNGHYQIEGYRTEQALLTHQQRQAAFGYMFSQHAGNADLLDFNRERHALPWRQDMPTLPPSFGTYDLFTANGQGLSGQFRLVRNDVGSYKEPYRVNNSESQSGGIEIGGVPNTIKVGIDATLGLVESTASGWSADNPLADITKFTDGDGKTLYEPSYFRASDEMTATDLNFLSKIGGTLPVKSKLDKASFAEKLLWEFTSNQATSSSQSFQGGSTLKRPNRELRNTSFQYLNSLEASRYGLEKDINSYQTMKLRFTPDSCMSPIKVSRRKRPLHHISEISVVKPDGSRYVYGIPAYNNKHKSVSFSVDVKPEDIAAAVQGGLVAYHPEDNDNTVKNKKGKDWFYDAEEIPPYAASYLLTGVLSPDYQDRTGDGITYDDYGTAVRLNYTKTTNNYKWRTPFGSSPAVNTNIARYNKGRKCSDTDDKASYLYGEKELWYVHSIESGGMVAQFYTSDRDDALGAMDENGGLDNSIRMQRLDSIKLYNKSALLKDGNLAAPIKTVHFYYEYELCPDTYNSLATGNGKLTLKKVWFTYGKSGKGKFNAYHFTYNNPQTSYDMQNIDRWGAYKNQPAGYPVNTDFPYALQAYDGATMEIETIKQNAGQWNLSEIGLPTGGKININYEADNYAYVQQKRAGQMFFIQGFSTDAEAAAGDIHSNLYDNGDSRNYIWVDLGADAQIGSLDEAKVRYLADVKSLWFNVETALDENDNWENVTGYLTPEITEERPLHSITAGGYHRYLGIPVKSAVKEGYKYNSPSLSKNMQPITKAALQLLRLELPEKLYVGYNADTGLEAFLKSIPSLIQSVSQTVYGYDEAAMLKGRARKTRVALDEGQKKSWLRLSNPTFKKYGGGHRVQSILLSDNWSTISNQNTALTATYGQTYDYSTTTKVNYDGEDHDQIISSGVASWEPGFGGEENLWKEPLTYREKIKLAPDNSYYVETPFLEELFPAAVVGYSQVKVQSINGDNDRTSPGWTVHEFFTAKEFPVIVDFTNAEKLPNRTGFGKIRKFFKIFSKDYLTMSQGFSIEVNDMHGKMKSEQNYAQNGSVISSAIYHYKVDSDDTEIKHLSNYVNTVNPDGEIKNDQQLGLDIEMWRDYRQEQTITQGFGLAVNTDAFFLGVFPAILGLVKSILHKEDVRFRSAVNTKFIKRHGILDKITKMQDGSTITTENILYDAESGNVLATKTQNEFEDPIYQFTYPAHWAYEGMRHASATAGAWFEYIEFLNGVPYRNVPGGSSAILTDYDKMFVEGDEVLVLPSKTRWGALTDPILLTVYTVQDDLVRFHDVNGAVFNAPGVRYFVKVLRSGHRNMADMPIGTIVSKTDPNSEDNIHTWANAATTQIVDASANTFKDLWQRDCFDCISEPPLPKSGARTTLSAEPINPYRNGMKGNWRLENTLVNHRNRTSGLLAGTTDIRTTGTTNGFEPYWLDDVINGCKINPDAGPNWITSSTAMVYDFKGNQIEEKDALDIFSSAQYGFFHQLNKSVVHNAKFRETAFDHFEDYDPVFPFKCDETFNCDAPMRQYGVFDGGTISPIHSAHTGQFSYQVPSGGHANRIFGYKTADGNDFLTALDNVTFGAGADNCISKESLSPGKHIISVWVNSGNCAVEISFGMSVKVYVTEPGEAEYQIGTSIQPPAAPSIDGWRRIYGTIDIPAGLPTGSEIKIKLQGLTSAVSYFDDFRIHPFLANMKSYVHDPVSFRLMATLDENNYATFYEYDDEGMLIRVKRETERGIMTIQEHRNSLRPNNN